MTEADQIRARLDQLAEAEHTNPSPIWPPVAPDDHEQCPERDNDPGRRETDDRST